MPNRRRCLGTQVPGTQVLLVRVAPIRWGLVTGNYLVAIHGRDLRNVTRVLFGKNLAAVQTVKDSELIVLAPQGPEGPVPVRLETNVVLLGRELDNALDFGDPGRRAFFTYMKPPAKQ